MDSRSGWRSARRACVASPWRGLLSLRDDALGELAQPARDGVLIESRRRGDEPRHAEILHAADEVEIDRGRAERELDLARVAPDPCALVAQDREQRLQARPV